MTLPGRLGLDTASIPHADRHGLVWLSRGRLSASDGTLRSLRRPPQPPSQRRGKVRQTRSGSPPKCAQFSFDIDSQARAVALKIFASCLEFPPQARG